MTNKYSLFKKVNNTLHDLQAATSQTYEQHFLTFARLIADASLKPINQRLTADLDVEDFLDESQKTQSSMLGSAQLVWPADLDHVLGLKWLLIQKLAGDSRLLIGFAHTFYFTGQNLTNELHSLTRQLLLPFVRDYKDYVEAAIQSAGESAPAPSATSATRTLSDDERGLLATLLGLMPDAVSGVDVNEFRAQHRHQRALLDKLQQEHVIERSNERYFLTIPALALLATPAANRILSDADDLYAVILKRYDGKARALSINDLAQEANLTELEARRALSYMVTGGGWLHSHPTDIMATPNATITVADGVLDHDSFRAIVAKLEYQRTLNPFTGVPMLPLNEPNEPEAGESDSGRIASNRAPTWLPSLPDKLRLVLEEVYAAMTIGLRVLPAMGIRTALDLLFADVLGADWGTFEEKIKKLKAQSFFSASDEAHVMPVIESGNAAAHRGHIPDETDLDTMREFAERLIYARFILPTAASRMVANTPVRPPKPPKTT